MNFCKNKDKPYKYYFVSSKAKVNASRRWHLRRLWYHSKIQPGI